MDLMIVEPEATGHRMALYVRLLVRACAQKGWTAHLLTTKRATQHAAFNLVKQERADLRVSFMEDVSISNRIDAVSLLKNQLKYYRAIRRGFRRSVTDKFPDFVYVNNLDYFDKVLAALGSPFGPVPFGGMMMDVKFHRRRMGIAPASRSDALYEMLFRRLLRIPAIRAATVIDEAFASYTAQRRCPEYAKIFLVPDVGEVIGTEAREESRQALGIPRDAFVVLVYGSLTRRKGSRELIEALAYPQAPSRAAILLAGVADEYTDELLRSPAASALTASRRIFVSPGFHDDLREHRVFNAADAVWLGYVDNFFGSSGVLYQAGAMGLPVLTTRSGLIGWLNKRHEIGIALDPREPGEVMSALQRLIDDPSVAVRAGANGRRFSRLHSAERFQEAVLRAIGTGSDAV